MIGMVAVIVNLAQMFKDAGLSMATVQKESISHGQISTLFWVNVLISIILGTAILLGAPLVAWFYRKPELTAVTAALSISFVLGGLTIQHKALLQRHMRFGTLAGIQIAGLAVSIAITILLACHGWRYWALVGGTLARAAADVLLTPFFCRWVPGRMRRGTGVREMLMFGGHMTAFNFINYFARNADNIIIGKFIGSEALGIYSRAYQLLMLPISMVSAPLSNVAVPALCRLNEDRTRLHRYYLHILYMLSLVASPIAGIAFLVSREIIIILLGPTWLPVSDVFKYLAIGGLLQPLYNTQGWLHLAVGRSDRVLIWGLIGTPIIVGSFIIGMIWGINGVAICYSLAIILTTVGSLAYAGRSAGLSFWKMFGAVFRPLLSCVAAVGVVAALSMFIRDYSPAVSIFAKGAGFVFFYATFLFLTFNGFKPMQDLVEIGRLITCRNTSKQA
ncbi:MAG: lipopolysaccharide biosynthesis protein [Kiritimatiellales bacterium]|nr:lipopolysaccharide biosynthesis protein [Kiritimatiellales bacterium]